MVHVKGGILKMVLAGISIGKQRMSCKHITIVR